MDFNTVKKLHQEGQLAEAKKGYLMLLKKNPRHVEVLHSLAILSAQQDQIPDALKYVEKAIQLQPKNPVLYLHLANILKIQGLFSQAIDVLNKIIQLDPNCISAYNNLGSVYFAQGKLPEAIRAYRDTLEKQSDYVDAHYNLGLALIKNNELESGITQFENLLQHVPEHFAARFHLACGLMQQEKMPQAEKHFLIIEESHPYHFETQTNLATCFLKMGALTEARKHYANALQLSPKDTQVLFNLGVVNLQLGNVDSAIQYYQRAVQADADFFAAHNNLGAIFIMKNQPSLALHHFNEALRLQPNNEAIRYTVQALSQNQLLLASPPDYITTLFDAYADHYEAHLLKALDYQVHQLLFDAIKSIKTIPQSQWDILDMGCGTGLCGTLFKSAAKSLIGVDLSKKMLEVAAEKNIYTTLIESDIVSFLQNNQTQYDLILAGDVLVYMGNLESVFSNISDGLRDKGLFAFNTEMGNEGQFTMHQSGRFLHQKNYLDALAEKYQLQVVFYKAQITRMQNNEPVQGHIYVLQKNK